MCACVRVRVCVQGLHTVQPLSTACRTSAHARTGFVVGLPGPLDSLPREVGQLLEESPAPLIVVTLGDGDGDDEDDDDDEGYDATRVGSMDVRRFRSLWPKAFVDGLVTAAAHTMDGVDGGIDAAGLRMLFLATTKSVTRQHTRPVCRSVGRSVGRSADRTRRSPAVAPYFHVFENVSVRVLASGMCLSLIHI